MRIVALFFGAIALLGVGGATVEPSLTEGPVLAAEAFTPAAASAVVRSARHAPARSAQTRPAAGAASDGPLVRHETAAPLRVDPGPPDPRGPPGPTAR